MDNEVYVMVFVRFKNLSKIDFLYRSYEIVWISLESALVIMTQTAYNNFHQLLLNKYKMPFTEIQLIRKKTC